jgi:hypothetical protein
MNEFIQFSVIRYFEANPDSIYMLKCRYLIQQFPVVLKNCFNNSDELIQKVGNALKIEVIEELVYLDPVIITSLKYSFV